MAELTPLYMDIDDAYSGDELGLPWRDVISEGVLGTSHLKVSQHAGTPDLSVDIAAGAAWILGDTNADAQPIYRCRNDAVVNRGISPDPSNPRKVLIIGQIVDETFAGTGREWEILALHGTPAASPVEPALPDSAIKLAVISVGAAATSIVTANITDTRPIYSVGGRKTLQVLVTDPNGAALTTGDGKAYIAITGALGGLNLVDVTAALTTNSSSGAVSVQVHNVTQAADMLTTNLTVDASEPTSLTAATPAVIDAANDDVAAGDIIRIDVDGAGTGAKGLIVALTFGA